MMACKSKYRFAVFFLFLLCALADLSEPCVFSDSSIPYRASLSFTSPKMENASATLPSDDDYFYCSKQPVVIETEAIPVPSLVTIGQVYQKPVIYSALQKEVFRPARAPTTISIV